MSQKGLAPVVIVILIAVLGLGGYFIYQNQNKSAPKQIACTLDAKICPDGSSVGRSGPKCDFATCPTLQTTPSPQTSDEITQILKAYALEYHHYKNPMISIEFIQNDYARGNIGEEPSNGAKWFAAKISNLWTVVHMGNGLPECKDVSKYNLPQSFLACY